MLEHKLLTNPYFTPFPTGMGVDHGGMRGTSPSPPQNLEWGIGPPDCHVAKF